MPSRHEVHLFYHKSGRSYIFFTTISVQPVPGEGGLQVVTTGEVCRFFDETIAKCAGSAECKEDNYGNNGLFVCTEGMYIYYFVCFI